MHMQLSFSSDKSPTKYVSKIRNQIISPNISAPRISLVHVKTKTTNIA